MESPAHIDRNTQVQYWRRSTIRHPKKMKGLKTAGISALDFGSLKAAAPSVFATLYRFGK
jgi:hypothetical protein